MMIDRSATYRLATLEVALHAVTMLCLSLHPANGEAPAVPSITAAELGYSVRLWTVEDGIPADFISCLAQSPDGYLWWPNHWGLARFDGVRLKTFLSGGVPDPASQLSLVFCDSLGRLWTAGNRGVGMLCNGKLDWTVHFQPEANMGRWFADASGEGWLGVRCGSETHLLHLNAERPAGTRGYRVPLAAFSVASNQRGRVWLTAGTDVWEVVNLAEGETCAVRRVDLNESRLSRLFRLRNGSIAVVGPSGAHALENGRWVKVHRFASPIEADFRERYAAQDQIGNYWIATRASGLWVSTPEGWTGGVELPGLLLGEGFGIGSVLCDRENNVWVGTRDGLYELHRVSVRRVLKSEALNATEIVQIGHSPQRGVWALTESGQVFYFSSVDSPPIRLEGLGHGRFLKVGEQGELWVTSNRKIWRFRGGAVEQSIQFSEAGLAPRAVTSLATSRDTAWIGTSDSGLWRVSGGRLAREDLPVSSSNSQTVWVDAGPHGAVRALVNGIGLCERRDNRWLLRPLPEPLRKQDVSGIHLDPESRTWIYGNDPPLVRQDGSHWKQVPMPPTEVPIEVIAAASGDDGGLWALTKSRGVFRIDRDFDAPSARDLDWLNVGDGLPSNAGRGWDKGVTKSADGRMWFTTALGVAVIDPREWRAVKKTSVPPQVHIEELLLDGLPFDWRDSKPVSVPPSVSQIEIRFTAIGLKNPGQNQFRYRLEGLDESWSEPGGGRSAVFHRLPAGRYVFQVIACNSEEVWNRQGATLQMTVLPHWWQTFEFRIGMGLLVVGALATVRRLKLRQLAREQVRREEFSRQLITSQEAERRRIARELHDGMGQDLLLIKNAAMLTLRKFSPGPAVQERLAEVSQLASHALGDVRAITNDLRPPELDRLGLTSALEAMAEKLANNSGVTLDWKIDDLHGLWSPELEINLYRIVQESVNNAFKHAAPGRIRLEVTKGPGEVEILVEDDGIGFDPRQPTSPGRQQGMGLTGLQERVKMLGGMMELRSAPGAGTLLRYRLPIPTHGQG